MTALGTFYETIKDGIRLVILDGIMPVMNGKEAYEEITSLSPAMRCIFMSGNAENVFTKDGVLQAGVEFIAKPVTPSLLLNRVRAALDKENASVGKGESGPLTEMHDTIELT